jgi:hypothetical protein
MRTCSWPGCQTTVPADMWGCRSHWFRLPRNIRTAIWAAYRPGQETTLEISDDYRRAFKAAQDWIREQGD